MRTARSEIIARNLAAALLAGVWSPEAMARRIGTVLGRSTRKSQKRLVEEVCDRIDAPNPPSLAALKEIVASAPSFERAARPLLRSSAPLRMNLRSPRFAPLESIAGLNLPKLATPGDIAHWLGLPIEHLDWFTDERRLHGSTEIPVLQHYTYAFRAKSHGPPRLIEAPKPRLKTMQRRILSCILDQVPAHDAAHGFVSGRSCRSGAELHVGAEIVVCLDIADFFLTTPLGRVHALFRCLGFPYAAARVMTRLCSTVTPETVFDRLPSGAKHSRTALQAYCEPHLPQGAPTSPALANLVAWRLDVRLSGLARTYGARYSRYADDLTFSGDATFGAKANSLIEAVTVILEDEGYTANERKTQIMAPSRRQQVTGIVVNAHLNVARDSYDVLKATLHNCIRNGFDAENRSGHPDFRAHLEGRVGWVESVNPVRGRRLRSMLEKIL